MSAASSACDHIRDWVNGTAEGSWVSMGVYSDGSYGYPEGLIYSYPVTCKDGKWSDQPGVTWGQEVPLGEGDVNIEAYLKLLKEIGYTGPLTIEREIPQDPDRQLREIGNAVKLLTDLQRKLEA